MSSVQEDCLLLELVKATHQFSPFFIFINSCARKIYLYKQIIKNRESFGRAMLLDSSISLSAMCHDSQSNLIIKISFTFLLTNMPFKSSDALASRKEKETTTLTTVV